MNAHTRSIVSLFAALTASLGYGQIPVLQIQKPIAVDFLPSVGLVVLDSNGAINEFALTTLQLTKKFQISPDEYPVDMTLAQNGSQFFIFVSSNKYSSATFGGAGRVSQYNLDGKLVYQWAVKGLASGIDYDGNKRKVYIAVSDENKILEIDISQQITKVSFVADVSQVIHIGAIAFDQLNSQIYVADSAEPRLCTVDLSKKQTSQCSTDVGLVSGLRVDESGRVIASDSSKGTVTLLARLGNQFRATKVISGFMMPTSVATLIAGKIAVVDEDQNRVVIDSWPNISTQTLDQTPVKGNTNNANGASTDGLPEMASLHHRDSQLLSAPRFMRRVCLVKGHFLDNSGIDNSFHLYIYTSDEKAASCPSHDQIRKAKDRPGNSFWTLRSPGDVREFQFPPDSSNRFTVTVVSIDRSQDSVEVKIAKK
jgi:hypothetical protein